MRLARILFLVLLLSVFSPLAAQDMTYNEAPDLTEMVAAGDLPSVEERLPDNPVILEPVERIGVYGGSWRMVWNGSDAWMRRTVGYEGLVRWNREWTEIIPNVAESWEANEDASEYTFYLREGLRWSDGEPYTVDDILFWYDAVLTHDEMGAPSWMTINGEIGVIEKIDDYTVVFRFAGPNGLLLQNLASVGGLYPTIYPEHYLSQFHPDYNPDGIDALLEEAGFEDWRDLFQAKGAGLSNARWRNPELPTLDAWQTQTPFDGVNTQVVLVRNPYYWKVDTEGNQLPYLDRVVFTVAGNAESVLFSALNGEIDFQNRYFTALDNKAVVFDNQESGNYHFMETIPAGTNIMMIALNLTHTDPVKREIFQNKDFRIGLSHAIDRQSLIDLVLVGQGEPYQIAPRPESRLYNERLAKQYTEFDLDLANEYLDRAFPEKNRDGIRLGPDGRPISFAVTTTDLFRIHVDMLQEIQMSWREVGIDMQVDSVSRGLFYERKDANNHDATAYTNDTGGMNDMFLDARPYFPFNNESNFAIAWAQWFQSGGTDGEEPPELPRRQMDLYNQIMATADPAEQDALMSQILELAADQFWAIGISLPANGYGIVRNDFFNVPAIMPDAWIYPTPAPTDPPQYFSTR